MPSGYNFGLGFNTFVTHPHKYLSDIKPEDEEDKEAEEEEVVDVIVLWDLSSFPTFPIVFVMIELVLLNPSSM